MHIVSKCGHAILHEKTMADSKGMWQITKLFAVDFAIEKRLRFGTPVLHVPLH